MKYRLTPYSGPVPNFRMFTVTDECGDFVLAVGGESVEKAMALAQQLVDLLNAQEGKESQ